MDWAAHLDTALVAAAVGAASSLVVPELISRLPEPPPESDDDAPEPEGRFRDAFNLDQNHPDKIPYQEMARARGLRPLAALAGLVLGAGLGAGLGWSVPLLFCLPLVPVGIALAVIDWRSHLLPSLLVWRCFFTVAALMVLGAVLTTQFQRLGIAVLCALAVFVFFFLLYRFGPMGFGDVRLSLPLGLVLGWFGTATAFWGTFTMFVVGSLIGLATRAFGRKYTPLGPSMLLGTWLMIVFSEAILSFAGY